MWVVVLFKNQKFSIETTGEETLQDIKNILTDVYGFSTYIQFSFLNTPISDKKNMLALNKIEEIQGYDVVELRIINQEKLLKDFPRVPPDVKQVEVVQMGLNTDTQSANNESTPSSSRRSGRSTSNRLTSKLQASQPKSNSKDKSSSNSQVQSKALKTPTIAQTKSNVQPKQTQTQNNQSKPAPQNNQPKPAPQNNQPKPAPQNNQPKPAPQNNQPKPTPQNNQPKQAPKFTFSKQAPQNNQQKQTPQNAQQQPPPQFNRPKPAQNQPKTSSTQNPQPSQNAQSLMSMGFTQEQAENALRNSNNDLNAAANYLLNNSTGSSSAATGNGGSTTTNSNVQSLMEMGFTQKQAEDALRTHNNDPNAAANFLFGNM